MSVTGQTVLVVELLFIMVVELREEDPAVGDGVISLEQDWSFCLDLGIGEGVEWLIMVPMEDWRLCLDRLGDLYLYLWLERDLSLLLSPL